MAAEISVSICTILPSAVKGRPLWLSRSRTKIAPVPSISDSISEALVPIKLSRVTFSGDGRLQIDEETADERTAGLDVQQADIVQRVGGVVNSYLSAVRRLLSTKYAHIKDWVPVHLAEPRLVFVVCCPDGVAIRYERKTDRVGTGVGWTPNVLADIMPILSQGLVHCYPDRQYTSTIPTTGMEMNLFSMSPTAGTKQDIMSARIGFDVVLERPERLPAPPEKPFGFSIVSIVELQMFGQLLGESIGNSQPRQFLMRTTAYLPVTWECLEIFPYFDVEQWDAKYADIWAERDMLAVVVSRQFREAEFESLDPHASARRQLSSMLKSYKDLLDSNPEREETLQVFLRDHPVLICPTYTAVWPKLALGARETDFVFLEASSDYLLVELEKSTHRLFRKDGHTTEALNHARGQVIDWKRYLEDNLSTVQRELGLSGISANPKSLIVIGRGQSLTPQNKRKLVSIANESPTLKIMTYDDVYQTAKAVIENLLGAIWEVYGDTRVYYFQAPRNLP